MIKEEELESVSKVVQ